MNDTTRRFLGELLTQVREEGVVELRLFPPLRQGGMESGLAVIAVEPTAVGPHAVASAVTEDITTSAEAESVQLSEAAIEAVDGAELIPGAGPIDNASPETDDADNTESLGPDDQREGIPIFHHADGPRAPAPHHTANHGEQPHAVNVPLQYDEATALSSGEATRGLDEPRETSMALGDILALPSPGDGEFPTPLASDNRRLAILTARYKLTVRGPDRGRWDMEVIHEADAPLVTLDRVIKGVLRRSGEGADPETYSARSLRDALDAPAWLEPE